MRWTQLENPEKGQDGHHHHAHRGGLKGRCMHPLFGAGVATAVVAVCYGAWRLLAG